VNGQNNPFPEKQGFSTQDILWALGIWSVILSLSPVVVFYVLMVNSSETRGRPRVDVAGRVGKVSPPFLFLAATV
jgi:hypothetical protein